MKRFPRIRMRSRIKVYNEDKTEFSVGTVMSRCSNFSFVLRFDGVNKTVCLEDMSTWEFVQTHHEQPIGPQSPQPNSSTEHALNEVSAALNAQHAPVGEAHHPSPQANRVQSSAPSSVAEVVHQPAPQTTHAHNKARLPTDTESEIQGNIEPEEDMQALANLTERRLDILPGVNLPPTHPDSNPQPVSEKRQSRTTSARNPRKSKRSREGAALKRNGSSRRTRKKQKRVNFGPPSIVYFDSNADGSGSTTPRTSDSAAESEKIEGRASTRTRDRLPDSRGKKAVAPFSATPKHLTSNVDCEESSDSLRKHKRLAKATNAEYTSSSAAAGHEGDDFSEEAKRQKSTPKLTTSNPEIDEVKDCLKGPRRSARLKKLKERRYLPRGSSLIRRDPRGKVTKASKLVVDKSLTSHEHAVQRKDDNTVDESGYANKGIPSRDVGTSDKMIRKALDVTQDVMEEDPTPSENAWGDISAEKLRGDMASAVEDIATRKTQEIIDHLGRTPDLFLYFPDFKYAVMGNTLYAESIDVLGELMSESMTVDAINFANTLSNSKKEFTEAVALFVEFQLERSAQMLKEIRLKEIDNAFRRKRTKSDGTGSSSAGIMSRGMDGAT